MGELDLIVGHTYEAKRPRADIYGLINDRQLLHVGMFEVQYDGPAVQRGRHFPRITKEKFLKWAARDVSAEMPEGEWRKQS